MLTRRTAMKTAAVLALPNVWRLHGQAPSETVLHASFGTAGMAGSDIKALTSHKNLKLVAICDVDTERLDACKKLFPKANAYTDWRELLDKEKHLNSVNVSTPDHMHAPIAMSAMNRGLHVYCQKPLTHTLHECRRLAEVAAEKKLVTQMGVQMLSQSGQRSLVKALTDGLVGQIQAIHCWMGKGWGDPQPTPDRKDPVPDTLKWDNWLGVAAERPYLGSAYYHPDNWRKRLDFGGGTLGDMGCHGLAPAFAALKLNVPTRVKCTAGGANASNWGLDNRVEWTLPGSSFTAKELTLTWSDGDAKPPMDLFKPLGDIKLGGAGALYVGEKGLIFAPGYSVPTVIVNGEKVKVETVKAEDTYHTFVDAVRGATKPTWCPFSLATQITETVLTGCVAERFKDADLTWDSKELKFPNHRGASQMVTKEYRKGWEVAGL